MKRIIKMIVILLTTFLMVSCGNKRETIDLTEETKIATVRNIIVSEVKGTVSVTHNEGETVNAYEGMSLNDGDDVTVSSESTLTLDVDSDKHIFADENTHFLVSAEGEEENTKTIIYLIEGSVLCDIKEKLKENESFDVRTANSTMSVRGTVFRVCMLKGKDNSTFDLVEVYDGKVLSNIESTENNLTLEPGQCALIRKKDTTEEAASFVLAEDINKEFINETGLNISLDQAAEGEQGALKLSLENVPVDTLSRLENIIDEGIELTIEKKDIQDVKEKKETKKEDSIKTEKKEEVKVEEKTEEKKETTKEEKPVCNHLNYSKELIPGTCIKQAEIHETCLDCGHVTVILEEYYPSRHDGTQLEKHDEPSCSSSYRKRYMHCESCGADYDEEWAGPHIDENGDSICDKCEAALNS